MTAKRPSATNACLPCRKVKMKCVSSGAAGDKCSRCARKSLPCVFQQHCRGRKPGTRLSKKEAHEPDPTPPGQARDSDFWAESEGFQPHSLLSHQAMQGRFSLQNILSVNHGPGPAESRASNSNAISPEDPIVLDLVNAHVAACLLEYFMQKINPYISQLDPALHSLSYLRKCPFLLTAVLAAAAKAFESSLYPGLHAHAEHLFVESFRRGDKSTEVVQGICLLTYWKEPNDTRAWTSVGLAIRIAMDLGWHKLSPHSSRKPGLSELERREIRNAERTFLVLFVYDRSLSLQTGKPWMMERNDLTESADSWWQDPVSILNDRLLCGFVTLRLLSADTFDLLMPSTTNSMSRLERTIAVLDRRIHAWQSNWVGVVCAGRALDDLEPVPRCHAFMIRFYGFHLRLQLFSTPLQETGIQNVDRIYDLKPFWLSYQSALAMLDLVAESSALLYLVQDSIHVMTAYAAIFLIKLLLSSPDAVGQEIEPTVTKAIRDAANAFAALSAPPRSSCTYQARFLDKALQEFARISRGRLKNVNSKIESPSSVYPSNAHPHPHAHAHPPRREQYPSIINSDMPSRPLQDAAAGDPGVGVLHAHQAAVPAVPAVYPPYGQVPERRDGLDQSALSSVGFELQNQVSENWDFLLGDESRWDDMFASAGFSIQEGVFWC